MLRLLFYFPICLGVFAPSGFGATIQLIQGLPTSYIPGQSIAFDVRVPAISNLGSYNIDLVLEGSVAGAGTDYFFSTALTTPASTNYVFASSANFVAAANIDSPTRHRITLTDFDLVGTNVVPSVNDRVARVVLQTVPSYRGQLDLFVDAPLLILDTPNVTPTSVMDFDMIRDAIATTPPVELSLVPEPSSIGGMWAGLAVILAGRTNRRT
jgi:hypothetical protein